MSKASVILMSVVALLLVVLVLDRSRTPEQLKAVKDAADRSAQASDRLVAELRSLREEIARRGAAQQAPGVQPTSQPSTTADPRRNGKPQLGVDFLLPVVEAHWHPEWLGGTFREFERPAARLNPILENMASASAAAGLMNDSLCDQHPSEPELWHQSLATSVAISDDYKRFVFTIRPGVRWHRPAIARTPASAWLDRDVELTAQDFVFYLDILRNPDVDCPHLKGYFESLASAKALDDHTLELVWSKKEYTNLDGSLGLSPLPRHIYGRFADGSPIPPERLGAEFNKHWFDEVKQFVGVGGYRLDRFEPNQRRVFVRNPDYWGRTLHFERIEWDGTVMQPDPQLVAFKNGQVHEHSLQPNQYKAEILDAKESRFAALVPADPKAGRKGPFGWERVRGTSYIYVGWNLRRPLFADRRVRQALASAFPKKRVIDEVFMGLGRPQVGPVHPDSPYANQSLKDWEFDLERAKALLTEAGWSDSDGDGWRDRVVDGKRIPLRFKVTHYGQAPVWSNLLAVYRDVLRGIGVDAQPDPVEDTEWERRMDNKDFDGFAAAWQIGLDADFFQLWHSKFADEPKSSNYIGFKNPEVDALAERLRETFDLDERKTIARKVQAIIHEEQPYLFIRSGEGIFVWQNRWSGPDDRRELLAGVAEGLDAYHPLRNRSKLLWHIQPRP